VFAFWLRRIHRFSKRLVDLLASLNGVNATLVVVSSIPHQASHNLEICIDREIGERTQQVLKF